MSATLTTTRQTPTTVLFTVSTRGATNSLASKAQRGALYLVRTLTVVLLLAALTSKLASSTPKWLATTTTTQTTWLLSVPQAVLSTTIRHIPAAPVLDNLVASVPWPHVLLGAAVMSYLVTKRTYTTESLLVMRGLGIQTSSLAASHLFGARTRFIPSHKIQDVFIHEAFKGFEVRFYLAVVVEGETEIVVVFPVSFLFLPNLFLAFILLFTFRYDVMVNMTDVGPHRQNILPRRRTLETIWRGTRACLYELKG